MRDITLPNGERMSILDFLMWWRKAKGSSRRPGKGAAAGGCTEADIFSDCFVGVTPGSITMGSPGPLNGWTFRSPFGPKDGTMTFSEGNLALNCTNGTTPGGSKAHAGLATVNDITIQSLFTTFPGPIVPGRRYEWYVTNVGVTQMVKVELNEDGFLYILVGDPNSISSYSGVWTPSIGQHKIHVTVDALGVPRVWFDDVEVTMFFDGTGFSATSPGVGDAAFIFFVYITDPSEGSVQNMHVASGNLPTSTEFCCS